MSAVAIAGAVWGFIALVVGIFILILLIAFLYGCVKHVVAQVWMARRKRALRKAFKRQGAIFNRLEYRVSPIRRLETVA